MHRTLTLCKSSVEVICSSTFTKQAIERNSCLKDAFPPLSYSHRVQTGKEPCHLTLQHLTAFSLQIKSHSFPKMISLALLHLRRPFFFLLVLSSHSEQTYANNRRTTGAPLALLSKTWKMNNPTRGHNKICHRNLLSALISQPGLLPTHLQSERLLT